MQGVQQQDVEQLVMQCCEAMKHHQIRPRSEDACYELFVRALRFQDEAAWSALIAQFRPLFFSQRHLYGTGKFGPSSGVNVGPRA